MSDRTPIEARADRARGRVEGARLCWAAATLLLSVLVHPLRASAGSESVESNLCSRLLGSIARLEELLDAQEREARSRIYQATLERQTHLEGRLRQLEISRRHAAQILSEELPTNLDEAESEEAVLHLDSVRESEGRLLEEIARISDELADLSERRRQLEEIIDGELTQLLRDREAAPAADPETDG